MTPRASAAALCCLLALWATAPIGCHAARRLPCASHASSHLRQQQPQPRPHQQQANQQQPLHASRRNRRPSSLRALLRDWGDSGDPSGLGGILGARSIKPVQPSGRNNRAALTPEAAETSASSTYGGVFRPANPLERRSYATVEGVQGTNERRSKETVRVRARSAQDLRGQVAKYPNIGSGEENVGVVAVGTTSLSETYEGAESVAMSDAVGMQSVTGKPYSSAYSMLTAKPSAAFIRKANAAKWRSYGVSAGTVIDSLAVSGQGNGRIQLTQAERAVAMAQTQSGNADSWSIGQDSGGGGVGKRDPTG